MGAHSSAGRPASVPVFRKSAEARRHHADDGDGLSIHPDRLSDDRGIAAEPALPEAVAEDHHPVVPVGPLVGRERAAQHRSDAQGREEARHHELGDELLRRPLARQVDAVVVEARHRRERRVAFLPPQVVERGDDVRAAGTLGALLPDGDEAPGLVEGEALEEHGVDDREDRGVRADAQRERRDRHGGKTGILREGTAREAQVLPGRLEEGEPPAVADGFLRHLDAPELPDRVAARLFGRHPRADGIVDVHLEVGLELLGHLALLTRPPEEAGEPAEKPAQPPHERPSAGTRKRARMAVVRSHSRVSSSTWRRPARVSR